MDPLSGMTPPSALQPLLEDVSTDTAGLLRMLKPGQLLRATVLSSTVNALAQLRIGGATLAAQTATPLRAGQKLLLQVERGLPEPLLRIAASPLRLPLAHQLQQHAMARLLPPQEISRQLQAIQQQLKQLPAAELQRLPAVRHALRVLEPPAPDIAKLTPGVLHRAVQRSGLLLEPLLYSQNEVPRSDHKLQLLQVLRQLQPELRAAPQQTDKPAENAADRTALTSQTEQMLSRLMRLIEGSVARIQSHQAHALAGGDEPNRILWQVDLPLQVDGRREHLELKIRQERDKEDAQTAEHTWKIDVRFDFQELGQVLSRITLQGKRLHCAFWSDRAPTASRFAQALPRLERTLHEAGLEVSAVSSLHGMPQADERPASVGLLDEHA